MVQSLALAYTLEYQTSAVGGLPIVYNPGWTFRLMTVLTLTAGTTFVMWLGEQITERGIGNGMSLLIFAGIIAGLPHGALSLLEQLRTGEMGLLRLIALAILMAGTIAAVVFVERGHRKVTVQYAKRVVGRRMYGGSSTHIPLKVNTGGVIPVIFASSILAFPATIAQMFPPDSCVRTVADQLNINMPLHNLLYVVGIIFFAYFYTSIVFNPDDVAENMRKLRRVHSGNPAGQADGGSIDQILARITLVGAVYLAMVALLPNFLIRRLQRRRAAVHWRSIGCDHTAVHLCRDEPAVLLRRHVLADHRRCRDGHGAAGRVAVDHASLRQLHEEDADQGTARVTSGDQSVRPTRRRGQDVAERDHARTSWRRQRNAGGPARARTPCSEDFDGGYPPRSGVAGHSPGQARAAA